MLACADDFPAPELQVMTTVVICTLARYLLLQVRRCTKSSWSIYAYRLLPEVWCPCLVLHTLCTPPIPALGTCQRWQVLKI